MFLSVAGCSAGPITTCRYLVVAHDHLSGSVAISAPESYTGPFYAIEYASMDSSVTVGPRINYSVTTGPAGLLDIEFVNATSDWVEIKVSPIPGPGTYASMNSQLCITSSAAALAVCAHAEGSLSVTANLSTPVDAATTADTVQLVLNVPLGQGLPVSGTLALDREEHVGTDTGSGITSCAN